MAAKSSRASKELGAALKTLLPQESALPLLVAAPSLVPAAIESAVEQVSDQAAIMARYGADLAGATDVQLAAFYDMAEAAQSDLKTRLGQVMVACKLEAERRIRAQGLTPQGGGELVVPGFEVILVPEYDYLTNVDALREIQDLLADNPDAAKLVKHTPRHTVVVDEKWEAGATVSILALQKRFPQFAEQFKLAIRRADKAPKLVIKRRATISEIKNVTHSSESVVQ